MPSCGCRWRTIAPMASNMMHNEGMRLDKWLWAARFFKTRSLAVHEIGAGRVLVGGQPAKPAREIAVGDLIEVRRAGSPPVRKPAWAPLTTRLAGFCSSRGQERNLLPCFERLGCELSAGYVDSEAIVVCENGPIGRSDRLIRSDAFAPAVIVGDAQVNRSGTLEGCMPPLAKMP